MTSFPVVAPGVVILLNAAVGALLLVIGFRRWLIVRPGSPAAIAVAGLPLVSVGLLSLYVFSEDSYRDNGISRWQAYRAPGGTQGSLFFVSVVLLAACSGALVYAAHKRRSRAFFAIALTGGLGSLLLVSATVIGFSGN